MSTDGTATTPTVYVYYSNHFDLVWRRGWKWGHEHLGLYYRPYSDLEEAVTTRCLQLAQERGTAFQMEQGLSLREYLRRHPETLPAFQELAKAGRFELLGAGEAIIDVNLCDGETMVRNLVSGTRYARELFGRTPAFASHNDGFGSSAQFPQAARGCGFRGIDALSYSRPDAAYWRGLDGATVYVAFPRPGRCYFYDHCYYEPCLTCKGHGQLSRELDCPDCDGTGLRLCQGVYPAREWVDKLDTPVAQYVVCSEEMLPDPELPALVAAENATGPFNYVWGTQNHLMPLWQEGLDRADDPGVAVSSRVENNPAQTGTWVSRIRIKQAARRAEGWFYSTEKLLALMPGGPGRRLQKELDQLWLNLPMLFFHDAITGTHCDKAHEELLTIAAATVTGAVKLATQAAGKIVPGLSGATVTAEATTLAVFNPHSFPTALPVSIPVPAGLAYSVTDAAGNPVPILRQPSATEPSAHEFAPVGPDYYKKRGEMPPALLQFVAPAVPPLSLCAFRLQPQPVAAPTPLSGTSVEWAGFRVGWDTCGVRSIVALVSGEELLNPAGGPAGHLILEEDHGDPWGTRSLQRQRTSCAGMSRLLAARQTGDAVELIFCGKLENSTFGRETDPATFALEWYQTVRLAKGLPWVEFDLEIFWQSANRRIRVVFPSRSKTDRGLYKIPYGVLSRERYDMTETCLWSPNGDWPATAFAATAPDGAVPGLAVLNSGTPAVRIEDGNLMYSVLRSPGFGHCLLRYAQEYPMPTAEIRDGGHHRFKFAVMPFTGANLPEILQAGYVFNDPVPVFTAPAEFAAWRSGVAVDEPGVFVRALKPGYAGGMAMRVVEQLGQAREVTVRIPAWVKQAWLANLLEEPEAAIPLENEAVRLHLPAFAIRTLLLRK